MEGLRESDFLVFTLKYRLFADEKDS
jgi:hypothetical protein